MTSFQFLSVLKALFAAYRPSVTFVNASSACSSGMSRYLGGSFYLKVSNRGLDISVLVLFQVAFCTCNKFNSSVTYSLYSVKTEVL